MKGINSMYCVCVYYVGLGVSPKIRYVSEDKTLTITNVHLNNFEYHNWLKILKMKLRHHNEVTKNVRHFKK